MPSVVILLLLILWRRWSLLSLFMGRRPGHSCVMLYAPLIVLEEEPAGGVSFVVFVIGKGVLHQFNASLSKFLVWVRRGGRELLVVLLWVDCLFLLLKVSFRRHELLRRRGEDHRLRLLVHKLLIPLRGYSVL